MKYNVGWLKNAIYLKLRSCLPSREINVTFTLNWSMSAAAIDRNDCYPDKDRYVNERRVLKFKVVLDCTQLRCYLPIFTKTPISRRLSVIEVLFDILDIQNRFLS